MNGISALTKGDLESSLCSLPCEDLILRWPSTNQEVDQIFAPLCSITRTQQLQSQANAGVGTCGTLIFDFQPLEP
jgi:hypothetical protein